MTGSIPHGDRVRPPEETWARIRPLFEPCGITRVGELTGLDRLGIPVWFAVRPNARTLSVSQGKGVDDVSAKVSAAMEAIEIAHAEQPGLDVREADLAGIARLGAVADVTRLPQVRDTLFGARARIPWVEARDRTTGAPVWVPSELVNADATVPRRAGTGCFLHSTNGLASGNVPDEAVLHGLCEVVERDAVALWKQKGDAAMRASRIDTTTVDDPLCAALIERMLVARVVPILWDVTSDLGVATLRAALYDETSDAATRPLPVSGGVGCHPDRAVALRRALTEAAQSRLTAIAGVRDDLGRPHFRETQSASALSGFRALARVEEAGRPFTTVPSRPGMDLAANLAWVVERLVRAGYEAILTVDLSRPSWPVSVVRVIVPGLEGPTDSASYRPGARAGGDGARMKART